MNIIKETYINDDGTGAIIFDSKTFVNLPKAMSEYDVIEISFTAEEVEVLRFFLIKEEY